MLLYVERWLKVGALQGGKVLQREEGTPQGGVISPLLANIFLHFAFDKWMEREYPYIRFERYCDDIVVHCQTQKQAEFIQDKIAQRLKQCKLELNKDRTQLVYCQNKNHQGEYHCKQFDFLGYTFRPRYCPTKEGWRVLFTPCMSQSAKKKVMQEIRRFNLKTMKVPIQELASKLNPKVRGWINYYCKVNAATTYKLWWELHLRILRWTMKIRKMSKSKAIAWLKRVYEKQPSLFAYWQLVKP